MHQVSLKIAVVGSRLYPKLGEVKDFVSKLPKTCVFVSGGAHGVDAVGETAADACGLEKIIIRPKISSRYADKRAFREAAFKRNREIVEAADIVVAFWDGRSGGTKNTLDHAKELDKPWFMVSPNSPETIAAVMTSIKRRIAG